MKASLCRPKSQRQIRLRFYRAHLALHAFGLWYIRNLPSLHSHCQIGRWPCLSSPNWTRSKKTILKFRRTNLYFLQPTTCRYVRCNVFPSVQPAWKQDVIVHFLAPRGLTFGNLVKDQQKIIHISNISYVDSGNNMCLILFMMMLAMVPWLAPWQLGFGQSDGPQGSNYGGFLK